MEEIIQYRQIKNKKKDPLGLICLKNCKSIFYGLSDKEDTI